VRRDPVRVALLCIAVPIVAIIVRMTEPGGPPDDEPRAAPPALDAAVAATRAVDAARVELQTTVTGPAGPVAVVHTGAYVERGARSQASTDMSQVAAALTAAGQDLDGDWSQPTGVVVDGQTIYSQLGPMAEALGRAPDDWARVEMADVVGSGEVVDNDTVALALDPLGPLDLLRWPVAEIDELGREQVREATTRHLRASLDLTGGGGDAPPPDSFEARLVAAGIETLPVDVWIDDEGRVRRLRLSVDAAGELTTTFEVFDIGSDVEVAVPDPTDVIDPGQPD
jgi:hypothetical protein